MSSTSAPFGLRPSYHPSGVIRPVAGVITSGYASNIFSGSPVGEIADGSIALAAAGGTGVGGACGVFQGCEYTPNNTTSRVISNMWVGGATHIGDCIAYYTKDPAIVYEIQANATMARSTVGSQYDWSTNDTNAGNTVTGLSNVTLNVASNAANAGLRVVGLRKGPDNDWGDTYPVVEVQLSEHQTVATVAQF